MPDTPPQTPDPLEPTADPAAAPATVQTKATVNPVIAMTFVIVILLAVLIAMRLRTPSPSGELAELQAEIDRLSRSSGVIEGGEQLQDVAGRIRKDADAIVTMADRYKTRIDQVNAELLAKNTDLLRSEQYRQNLTNDLVNLKNELQQAKSGGYEAESLRREVSDLKALRDAQASELAALKQQLAGTEGMASKEDVANLQRQLDEAMRAKDFFESRATELEAELNKQRLFAKSENELLPAAVELFRTLRALENKTDSEIAKAYSEIGATLGATVVKELTFATGSAELKPEDVDPVKDLLNGVPDGDMLLVVGYASETGNVDTNRTLSSDRATNVAELLTSVKSAGQKVQAVYLGQTDRFGSRFPERNQCCEVWRIRAKSTP